MYIFLNILVILYTYTSVQTIFKFLFFLKIRKSKIYSSTFQQATPEGCSLDYLK